MNSEKLGKATICRNPSDYKFLLAWLESCKCIRVPCCEPQEKWRTSFERAGESSFNNLSTVSFY